MCTTFSSNPEITFCLIFRSLDLIGFGSTSTKAYIGTGFLVNAIPPSILPGSLLNFAAVCLGLNILGCNKNFLL